LMMAVNTARAERVALAAAGDEEVSHG